MDRFSSSLAQCIWFSTLACIVLTGRVSSAQTPTPALPPTAPPEQVAAPPPAPAAAQPATSPTSASPSEAPRTTAPAAPSTVPPEPAKAAEPFAFGDFTWLNGTNRQHKAILDSDIFTGSVLIDTNYTISENRPIDNTVVGSTGISSD